MRLTTLFLIILLYPVTCFSVVAESNGLKELQQAKIAMQTDIDLSEKLIEKALEKSPQNAEVHFICGRIMGRQAGNTIFSALSYAKKSLRCLKQAVALHPENTSYRMGLISFYLGAPGIAGGDEQLAWQEVQTITQLNALQGALAKLTYYRETEQTELYQKLIEQSRKDYPEHAEFHYRHGLLLQQSKQYSEAFTAFYTATDAQQDENGTYRLNAFYQIGRTALFSEQQMDDGINALNYYLQQALDSADLPDKFWAHFRLAQLHKLTNDNHKMQQHLALASNTKDKELQREIRKL